MNVPAQTQDCFTFNGVDPSGAYLTDPLSAEQLFEMAQEEFHHTTVDERESIINLSDFRAAENLGFDEPLLYDPGVAGWGAIVHESLSEDVKLEVKALICHRGDVYQITPKVFTIKSETSYLDFLTENGVSPGFGEVAKVPYYLLIVGDPTMISYRFQYELAAEYAVGRIAFSTEKGYRDYIEQLIDYEVSTSPRQPTGCFLGAGQPGDGCHPVERRDADPAYI